MAVRKLHYLPTVNLWDGCPGRMLSSSPKLLSRNIEFCCKGAVFKTRSRHIAETGPPLQLPAGSHAGALGSHSDALLEK